MRSPGRWENEMTKKYSIAITDAPVAEYRPTVYLSEDFKSANDAEARFTELAESFKSNWPEGYELWLGAFDGNLSWSTVKDIQNW